VRHLYIHVPFCRRRCSYCDFAIAVRRAVPSDPFVDSVLAEYGMRREGEGWVPGPFETVYLGGGTPSLLSPDAIARLIDAFPRSPGAEVTLEANPDDVTPERAAAWVRAGVSRISLGVQSLDDRALAWMHRTHDAAAARRAVDVVRNAGVASVSVDLIFGLPESLERDLAADLRGLLALSPDHISAYGLTLEPRTPYARWSDRGLSAPPPDERYAAEFLLVHETLGMRRVSSTMRSRTTRARVPAPATTARTGRVSTTWASGRRATVSRATCGAGTCGTGRRGTGASRQGRIRSADRNGSPPARRTWSGSTCGSGPRRASPPPKRATWPRALV
jgi:hypothetical protein